METYKQERFYSRGNNRFKQNYLKFKTKATMIQSDVSFGIS